MSDLEIEIYEAEHQPDWLLDLDKEIENAEYDGISKHF